MSNTNSAKSDKRFGWHSGDVHAKDIIQNGNSSVPKQAFTATGTVKQTSGLITLTHGTTPILLTLPNPTYSGQLLIIADLLVGASHVVSTKAGTTLDGTNNTATFNAATDVIVLMSVSQTLWVPVYNNGVVLSSV